MRVCQAPAITRWDRGVWKAETGYIGANCEEVKYRVIRNA